jgi:hypothetical protein
MLCQFQTTRLADGTYRHACAGYCHTSAAPKYVRTCDCRPWGNRLERWLARIGMTKQAYARWVGRERWCVIGGMNSMLVYKPRTEATCGCDQRRKWLNRWSVRLLAGLLSRRWVFVWFRPKRRAE